MKVILESYPDDSGFIKVAIEETFDELVERIIPIYTIKNLNPKSGKQDCPITTREKEHFRYVMKMKLQAAGTDEERQKVIDHYKSKWSEG